MAEFVCYTKTFINIVWKKWKRETGYSRKDLDMLVCGVFSEQTHIYFCISFTSLSQRLHRESSHILTLAPNMPSTLTKPMLWAHRVKRTPDKGEVILSPPPPLLSSPSLFTPQQIPQVPFFGVAEEMTNDCPRSFELDSHTVPIQSHMHVSIVLRKCEYQ